MVTTDWWTRAEHYKEIKAGNDVKMGTGFPDRVQKGHGNGTAWPPGIRALCKTGAGADSED